MFHKTFDTSFLTSDGDFDEKSEDSKGESESEERNSNGKL